MNGIEHYREAERLLRESPPLEVYPDERASLLQEAQVHATLALAAASVQRTMNGYTETVRADDWRRMLQTPTDQETGGAR